MLICRKHRLHGGIVLRQPLDGDIFHLPVGDAQLIVGTQQLLFHLLQMLDRLVNLIDRGIKVLMGDLVIPAEIVFKF